MELYWNPQHTEYAVLISPGYGAGWSSWNQAHKEIAYDKRVIEWYLAHNNTLYAYDLSFSNSSDPINEEADAFFSSLGYEDIYFGGFSDNMLQWVPAGTPWRVHEYDGAESIEYLDMKEWICFGAPTTDE